MKHNYIISDSLLATGQNFQCDITLIYFPTQYVKYLIKTYLCYKLSEPCENIFLAKCFIYHKSAFSCSI